MSTTINIFENLITEEEEEIQVLEQHIEDIRADSSLEDATKNLLIDTIQDIIEDNKSHIEWLQEDLEELQ